MLSGVSGDMEARPRLIHSHGKHCSQISDRQNLGQKLSLLHCAYMAHVVLLGSYMVCLSPSNPPPPPPPPLLQAFYSWIVLNCIPFSVNGDYTHTYLGSCVHWLCLCISCMPKKWPKRKLRYGSWLVRGSSTLVCHVVTSRPCVCVCAVLLCFLFPLLQFANSFTITMLFPFLPFMVKVTRTHTEHIRIYM